MVVISGSQPRKGDCDRVSSTDASMYRREHDRVVAIALRCTLAIDEVLRRLGEEEPCLGPRNGCRLSPSRQRISFAVPVRGSAPRPRHASTAWHDRSCLESSVRMEPYR